VSGLKAVALWALAAALVAWVLWRRLRGRPAVLPEGVPFRVIHLVAVLLVAMGCGPTSDSRQPSSPSSPATSSTAMSSSPATRRGVLLVRSETPFPASLTEESMFFWTAAVDSSRLGGGGWFAVDADFLIRNDYEGAVARTSQSNAADPMHRVRAGVRKYARGRSAGDVPTPTELASLLTLASDNALYYAPFGAYLWRQLETISVHDHDTAMAVANFSSALDDYMRVAESLLQAGAAVGPASYRPWMKMAPPPRGYNPPPSIPAGYLAAARQAYQRGDSGSWASEATLPLRVVETATDPVLHRSGHEIPLGPGTELDLRRFDVIHVPSSATAATILEHPELGRISVPPGEVLAAWNLPGRLSSDAQRRLRERVTAALGGNEDAVSRLEAQLPAAHVGIRDALERSPSAPGAPALRTLLTLYDE